MISNIIFLTNQFLIQKLINIFTTTKSKQDRDYIKGLLDPLFAYTQGQQPNEIMRFQCKTTEINESTSKKTTSNEHTLDSFFSSKK